MCVEGAQCERHISRKEKGSSRGERMDCAMRRATYGQTAGHTHHTNILTALNVDAGPDRAENHCTVPALIQGHRPAR